jgi:hypothetical protein
MRNKNTITEVLRMRDGSEKKPKVFLRDSRLSIYKYWTYEEEKKLTKAFYTYDRAKHIHEQIFTDKTYYAVRRKIKRMQKAGLLPERDFKRGRIKLSPII